MIKYTVAIGIVAVDDAPTAVPTDVPTNAPINAPRNDTVLLLLLLLLQLAGYRATRYVRHTHQRLAYGRTMVVSVATAAAVAVAVAVTGVRRSWKRAIARQCVSIWVPHPARHHHVIIERTPILFRHGT